jgi:hypothetical protein
MCIHITLAIYRFSLRNRYIVMMKKILFSRKKTLTNFITSFAHTSVLPLTSRWFEWEKIGDNKKKLKISHLLVNLHRKRQYQPIVVFHKLFLKQNRTRTSPFIWWAKWFCIFSPVYVWTGDWKFERERESEWVSKRRVSSSAMAHAAVYVVNFYQHNSCLVKCFFKITFLWTVIIDAISIKASIR